MCIGGGTKAQNEANLKAMQERKAIEAQSKDSTGNTYTAPTKSSYSPPSGSSSNSTYDGSAPSRSLRPRSRRRARSLISTGSLVI